MSLSTSTPKDFHSPKRRIKTALVYGKSILLEVKNKKTYFNCFKNNQPGIIEFKDGLKVEVQGRRCVQFMNSIFFNKIYGLPDAERVMVDIGANKGLFSIFFASQLKGKNFKIFSFEPHPKTFQLLERNILHNDFNQNIFAFQKCVSGVDAATQTFFVARESFDYSMYNEYATEEEVIVENITLEEIINQNKLSVIDLLKMNCEGAEYEILMNTSSNYLDRIRAIRMEYHNFELNGKKYDLEPLILFLQKNNFTIVNHLPYSPSHGIIWFKNKNK